MSQLLLDEQIDVTAVVPVLRKWITVEALTDLWPEEQVLDGRVPALLRTLKQPTFPTIDQHFWHRRWGDPSYCILYFDLRDREQKLIPGLLRALFRQADFRSRALRMGKVACVGIAAVRYWQFRDPQIRYLLWPLGRRRKR